ncbi:xylulokinase [Wenyingzhuangia marina]|uniref:Xylulokinase n=1 Tax=Wenyingzhuangia marina TaxID=1195760 RepID=A0A1M5ULV3_9FLAO|nr:FGGY family carbohydrate kinase [Wenyingzhuangia marina]GGF66910.1 carbohydrate kinase [Wenyingzhuangia marina]SHH63985.1 xylulokinase [Wenyingzhuangia marina]
MLLIGYDLGSSSVKASLVDSKTKKVLAMAQYPEREMPIDAPKENWAEQHPNDWWANIKKVTNLLFEKTEENKSDVVAIGIAYQMHGLVTLTQENEPARPAIIWCDSRAVEVGNKAFKEIGEEKCLESLLNSPGNFTASKLKWIQENEPEVYKTIKKIMLPGDFIAYKFTGKHTTTNTGLSEGIFWDFKKEELSQTIMNHYGFEADLIPEIVPVFANQGQITREMAAEFGFNPNAVVSYRAGDQPNNAFSLSVLKPGEIAATGGTSGVVYGVVDQLKYDPENRVNTFAHINHTEEVRRLGVLLCINGTGSAYAWLRNNLAADKDYFELETLASSVEVGANGLSFLPFGNGAERMLQNKIIGAQFDGLQFTKHKLAHMVRACLEGIAFSFVYGIKCMAELGLSPSVIKVGSDNMFQSKIFATTIATLTNAEIQVKETNGAVGAAIGAGYGAGEIVSLEEAFIEENIIKTYQADSSKLEAYTKAYDKWLTSLEIKLK